MIGVGLPAIVLGGAFIRAARAARSSRDPEAHWFAVGCAGSLSALLIHSVFDFNTYVLSNAMVLAWVAGLAASTRPSPWSRQGAGQWRHRRASGRCSSARAVC